MLGFDPFQIAQSRHGRVKWLRVARRCNNRCRFCFEAGEHDGSLAPLDALLTELRAGAADGARHLVLSGGEPSLHPDLAALLAEARRLGYRHLQLITNGRRLAYGRFARHLLAAGLHEVTLALHSDVAATHDELVGVPGAWEQTRTALEALGRRGGPGCRVTAQIMLTTATLPGLSATVDFLLDLRVRGLHLLWPLPAGRAWDPAARALLPEATAAWEPVQLALRQLAGRGLGVELHGLPASLHEAAPALLPGFPWWRQQLALRREPLEAWLRQGSAARPACRDPTRCGHCALAAACDALALLAESPAAPRAAPDGSADVPALRARLDRGIDSLHVLLNQETAGFLRAEAPRLRALGPALTVSLARFARRREACRAAVDPLPALVPLQGLRLGLAELPRCIAPVGRSLPAPPPRAGRQAPQTEGLDADALTTHLLGACLTIHAAACQRCQARPGCAGFPWQHVRVFGFGLFRPITGTDAALVDAEAGIHRTSDEAWQPRRQRPGDAPAGALCPLTLETDGRASVVIETPCQNACGFCTTHAVCRRAVAPWRSDPLTRILATLQALRAQGSHRLRLSGIEPLEHPDLLALLRAIPQLGFSTLTIWSHAGPLAEPGLADAILAAGLVELEVPVFGPDAATHDAVAGRSGAFDATRQGLMALRARGFQGVVPHLVICGQNHTLVARTLAACDADPQGFGPLAYAVLAMPPSEDPADFRHVAAPFGATARALAAAPGTGVTAGQQERAARHLATLLPLCTLLRALPQARAWAPAAPPLPDRIPLQAWPCGLAGQAEATRGFAEKQAAGCPYAARCGLATRCAGVHPHYLALFGAGELSPE